MAVTNTRRGRRGRRPIFGGEAIELSHFARKKHDLSPDRARVLLQRAVRLRPRLNAPSTAHGA